MLGRLTAAIIELIYPYKDYLIIRVARYGWRMLKYGWSMFMMFMATPFAILVFIIRPVVHVRFNRINRARIGHFVADACMMLAFKTIDSDQRYYDLCWYSAGAPANSFFDKKIHELLDFNIFAQYVAQVIKYFPYGAEHTDVFRDSRDKDCVFYRTINVKSSYVNFDKSENKMGFDYLRKHGINQGDKFVCLLVRDSAYLESFSSNYLTDKDWSYHDYRNSDIDTYSLMVDELIKRGYWVIRMGKVVKKKMAYANHKMIDYACLDDKSDFLDIWLMANCFFCVTTGTGLDKVCQAYRVPQVFVNSLPLIHMSSCDHGITATKKLCWKGTNKLLTLNECFDNSYQGSQQYYEHSIDIVDMSNIEIKNVVIEMEERLTGKWVDTERDKSLQAEFKKVLKKHKDYTKYHNCMHPEARYSTSFLRQSPDWIR